MCWVKTIKSVLPCNGCKLVISINWRCDKQNAKINMAACHNLLLLLYQVWPGWPLMYIPDPVHYSLAHVIKMCYDGGHSNWFDCMIIAGKLHLAIRDVKYCQTNQPRVICYCLSLRMHAYLHSILAPSILSYRL